MQVDTHKVQILAHYPNMLSTLNSRSEREMWLSTFCNVGSHTNGKVVILGYSSVNDRPARSRQRVEIGHFRLSDKALEALLTLRNKRCCGNLEVGMDGLGKGSGKKLQHVNSEMKSSRERCPEQGDENTQNATILRLRGPGTEHSRVDMVARHHLEATMADVLRSIELRCGARRGQFTVSDWADPKRCKLHARMPVQRLPPIQGAPLVRSAYVHCASQAAAE